MTTDENGNLLIFGPTDVTVDFIFNELTPKTSSMQTDIIVNLQEYLNDNRCCFKN